MKPGVFNRASCERGTKYAIDLEFELDLHRIQLPLLLIRGRYEGKCLVAMAAVHGDEYEGVRAILDVCSALDPNEMHGDFLAVTVANPPAIWNFSRTSPLDDRDLARCFPGSLGGDPTEAIAHYLAHIVIDGADFFLDLRSSGVKYVMPTMVGYDGRSAPSQEAAFVFGTKVIWGHPDLPPGRTISFAQSRGIPWLYTEAPGAGRIQEEDLKVFRDGIRNLLVYLSILPGRLKSTAIEHHLYGDGDTGKSLKSAVRGFLIPSVSLLQLVSRGEELGRIVDLHGATMQTLHAPFSGVVAMLRALPVVNSGDPVCLITGLAPQIITDGESDTVSLGKQGM
jgi:predicted deacylase